MTTANDAWAEFGSNLSALGLKLKLHYEQEHGESGDETDDDCTDPDTCDGAGSCLDNHETAGTACG